ncbi:MAG: cellulase family glycosylhydrolase [Acidobacteria bacterium]|nr:cellulase family glycosylhydrolase [Acidobacteriota bacterium]
MHSRPAILLLFLLLAGPASLAQSRFVRGQGAQLIDPAGKPLLLRGINLGNWLVPEGYMLQLEGGPQSAREIDALFRELAGPAFVDRFWTEWRKRYITEADIARISSLGFNSIRLPLHHSRLGPGGEDWSHIDNTVAWARKHRLWVILDLHAAPGGQTGTNIDDSWGYPWLFDDEPSQTATIDLWKRIAARYKSEPTILGYDLLNEPIPHFHGLPRLNPLLEPLYRRIAAAIRQVDPNHILIFEGAQWASRFDMFGPPIDPNAMYSFHKYWTAPTRDVIKDYLAYQAMHHVPLYMGESGENSDDWISRFIAVLEQEKVNWCLWPYKKMTATSAPISFEKPVHWDLIAAYAKLPGGVGATEKKAATRPSPQQAQAALLDLLDKVALDRCRPNPGFPRPAG